MIVVLACLREIRKLGFIVSLMNIYQKKLKKKVEIED